MENYNLSLAQAYRQALVNPQALSAEDFDQLLAKYPYSQPLHFAFERRRFFRGELNVLTGKSILMARNPSWLYDYVQLAAEEVPSIEVVDNDYVPFEEFDNEVDSPELENSAQEQQEQAPISEIAEEEETVLAELTLNAEVLDNDEPLVESDLSPAEESAVLADETQLVEEAEQTALDTLVQEGIGGGDYFALHAKAERLAAEKAHQAAEAQEALAAEELPPLVDAKREADNISLYNDDMMPYSFRWWLHKTRQEHAGTYQPFAFQQPVTAAQPMQFDPVKLDKHVLDQQIRQNIIHFQNPEDKLSDAIKQREVKVVEESKTAAVIERFIREEPQIQPPSADHLNNENKARKSSEEQFDLVTETLANIYVSQAMHVKAIEVYKKLILKNPEKKSYFADRIKELEEKLY